VIVGRRFWILIWYGILVLGILGLIASVHWGRRTHWKNVDEVLRAVGTILVSVGMLVLLYPLPWVYTEWLGEGLLGEAGAKVEPGQVFWQDPDQRPDPGPVGHGEQVAGDPALGEVEHGDIAARAQPRCCSEPPVNS